MDIDLAPLKALLKMNPNHMFVTDQVIAVLIPDLDRVLLIGGDFTGITEEKANQILQEELRKLMK